MSISSDNYSYIAYIDEAGEDGLRVVRPLDENGSSEWLILGAIVIQAKHETDTISWVKDILSSFKRRQKKGLHFRGLNEVNKILVCAKMASLPVRCFVIMSNKKNMKGYKNPWAEQFPSKNWFYCWLSRLLLERITYFVHHHSLKTYGTSHKLKIEYSERGGMSYPQLSAYFEWLKMKSRAGNHFLPLGDLYWNVMERDLLEVHNHNARAGLQLADVVASAFFKGCDTHHTGACDPQFAKLLKPRMARDPDNLNGLITGYGVKLMPAWKIANLENDQKQIFKEYGYPGKQWWMPQK